MSIQFIRKSSAKRKSRDLFSIFLFVLSFLSTEIIASKKDQAAITKSPIRISVLENNPPFSFKLPNGKIAGLYVDIWKEWSKKTGRSIIFKTDNYSGTLLSLQRGDTDFHSGLFINQSRLRWADFSLPIHSVSTQIFVPVNYQGEISISQFLDKKIGVGTGSFQENYLRNQYPSLTAVPFADPQQTIKNLLDGKIDAIISEEPFIDAQLGIIGLKGALKKGDAAFLVNTVHAMVPKGNRPLVELVNSGIKKIPKSTFIRLEKKWLPSYQPYFDNKAIEFLDHLSFQQQLWLRQHSSFEVAFNPAFAPLEFKSESGIFSGISSEYLKLISEKLNVRFSISAADSRENALEKIRKGTIDILPAVEVDDELASRVNFSKAYISFPNVIVTQKRGQFFQSLEELVGKKVGVVKSYNIGQILQVAHPELDLVFVDDTKMGLEMLQEGKLTAYVDNLAIISHEIKTQNFSSLKIANFTPYVSEMSIAVRKGLEPLIPIINQVLATISQKQRDNISSNWLAYNLNPTVFSRRAIFISVTVIISLVLFIIYVVAANRKMKGEIVVRASMEAHLEKATELAKEANRAKDEFLANMSHEIRTPMNAVVGISHLLEQSNLDKEQQSYLHTLNASANSLLYLIDDILDLSEIVQGELRLEYADFNLNYLIETVVKQASVRIEKQDDGEVSLNYFVMPKVPEIIYGDSLRLGQILLNLLSNALKFTQKGNIILKIELGKQSENNIELLFCVEDSGIGMSKEQQDKLFKSYTQAESSTSRKFGGTGLGLSICRKLCSLMKGEIWSESELGKGSTFFFTAKFPLNNVVQKTIEKNLETKNVNQLENGKLTKESTEKSTQDVVTNELQRYALCVRNKRVLVVDDNLINLKIVTKMLENFGVTVTTAINGEDSLRRLEEASFDAVLMDLQMPVMDGYQATHAIRGNPAYSKLPIIAFSANVMEKDIDKALQCGMNAHLAKPLRITTLLSLLSEQLLNAQESAHE